MNKLNLNKNLDRGDDCSLNQDEEDIIEKKCTRNTPRKKDDPYRLFMFKQ